MKMTQIFIAALFLLMGTFLQAQHSQQQALQEVGLSDAEIKEVRTTHEDFKEKAKAVRKNTTMDRKEQGTQLRTLQRERTARLQEIMGEERYVEYKKVSAEKRAANKGRRDEAMESLNLTDEQMEDLKAINEKYRAEGKTLRTNEKMSKEDMRLEGKELRQAQQKEIQSVMSEAQYKQYREMKKQKPTRQ